MSEISDAGVINALRRQMTVAVARQVASSGNLANVDTPGYKAREVVPTFGDALSATLRQTNATFPSGSANSASPVSPVTIKESGDPVRRDGNNVQMDQELLKMSRAAGDFAAAQTALAAKFRLVRYAINEGR